MGHEMGHYVLNHIHKGLMEIGIVIVVGYALIAWLYERLRRRYEARWRVQDVGDLAGLPLAALLLSTYLFLLTPVLHSIVRGQEYEADIFGLNLSCRRAMSKCFMVCRSGRWERWRKRRESACGSIFPTGTAGSLTACLRFLKILKFSGGCFEISWFLRACGCRSRNPALQPAQHRLRFAERIIDRAPQRMSEDRDGHLLPEVGRP